MRPVPYSSFGQFTVEETGQNISSVIDRMLRVTVKVTETYASDIIYDIDKLREAVNQNQPFYALLAFREHGVNTYQAPEDVPKDWGVLQVWELTVTPGDGENAIKTKFERVRI